ncbi:MAG: alpha-galactosidase [Verrucomicrobia bacterium]|nr:alpha-galactosidase [Verrucomicrobiota bacterium]
MKADLRAGRLSFSAGPFGLGPGKPSLQVDGRRVTLRAEKFTKGKLTWRGAGGLELTQQITAETKGRLRVTSRLRNGSAQGCVLNHVTLFAATRLELGTSAADVRILEQSAYLARVRTPRQMLTGSDRLKALDGTAGAFVSETHTVFYNPAARAGLLIGFETVDRWLPKIAGRMFAAAGRSLSGADNVDGGAALTPVETASLKKVPRFRSFTIGFDGGDLAVAPGETVALGDFVLEAGRDPLALLGAHGDRIKRINRFPAPPKPLANWCSWYPYRLGVTEERVLATARAARARHLDRLGLRIVQLDLGWEKDNLPTSFEENERFGRGLGWLSGELRREGFQLGVWVGVLCIADTHPVAREHPEWLLRGADGQPRNNYNWFWAPFCPVYALDVTHPGAQAWLRENFTALARKGVRFVKWDFAGVVTTKELRGRHDPRRLSGGAREAVRTAFRIAQEALDSQGEKALMIDCSGTDLAAAGIAGLSYAVMDTGNTGLGWRHLRDVYTSYACHLFKQRWALLQPSCLVTGLPGTLEEARIRATATFMGAGHVDLGDDLTKLPEDRWNVLLATLPPNDTPATPIDLFHPIRTGTLPYLTLVKAQPDELPREGEPQGACVWVLPVRADWDEWTLVAVFNWDEPTVEKGSGVNLARRYQVEFERLGFPGKPRLWAHEFWSGQFLGEIPRLPQPADSYRHPGDFSDPILTFCSFLFDIGFHGPAVKLLILRRPRAHPWPVGTSFHQSGGRELSDVRWEVKTHTLSGKLHRPPGESGHIFIAVPGPDGAVGTSKISLTTTADVTAWSIRLQ